MGAKIIDAEGETIAPTFDRSILKTTGIRKASVKEEDRILSPILIDGSSLT